MSLPNPSMDAVPFTPLTAAFLDQMIANIEALAAGTGLNTNVVAASKLVHGRVRNRQGGTTGDNTYWTSGTSNTDTTGKAIFFQAGSVGTATGSDTTVTYPTAFSQVPLVLATVNGANAGTSGVTQNAFAIVVSKTTTTCVLRTINNVVSGGSTGQSDQNVAWFAIGQ